MKPAREKAGGKMLAVIFDVHGRADCLEAVLKDVPNDVDRVVCCGDIVGNGPQPAECVDIVRRECDVIVQGNHDAGVDDFSSSWLKRKVQQYEFSQLSNEQVAWLHDLPERREVEGYLVTHKPVTDVGRVMYEEDARSMAREVDDEYEGVLFGHVHRRFDVTEGGVHVVNPGVVGRPRPSNWYRPRSMGVKPEYAVVDPDGGEVEMRNPNHGAVDAVESLFGGSE